MINHFFVLVICSLFMFLGCYSIRLVEQTKRFRFVPLASLTAGFSVIFYYYYFQANESLVITFVYYTIVLACALGLSKESNID